MRRALRVAALLVLLSLLAACGGDDKKDSSTPGKGGGVSTNESLDGLSLVYIDARNSTAQLFVAKADGTGERKVTELKNGARPFDVRNGLLLAGGGDQLGLIDLK